MSEESKNLLTGENDYNGWLKKTICQLEDKNFMNEEEIIFDEHERKAYNFIMSRISMKIAETIHCDKNATDLLQFLQSTYGGGNKYELKNKFKDFRMVTYQTDASVYLAEIDKLKSKALSAGAKISTTEEFSKLTDDVDPGFYLDYVRQIRIKYDEAADDEKLTNDDIKSIRDYFIKFYKATPKQAKKTEAYATSTELKRPFIKRHCVNCAKKFGDKMIVSGRIKICDTHNTDGCRNRNATSASSNEVVQPYFDSCASDHIFKTLPHQLDDSVKGFVSGSINDAQPTPIIGTGTFEIGNLTIEAAIF